MLICCTGSGKSLIFEALPSGLQYIRDRTEKDVSTTCTAVVVISPLIEYLEKVYTYV